MSNKEDYLLELNNVKKYFSVEKGVMGRVLGGSSEAVHAVDDITLKIQENEIFGLCGESGCGKSTTARVITGLDFETAGEFVWKGEVKSISDRLKFSFRKNIQLIFQNPFQSLHPRMTVGSQVANALEIQLEHPNREAYLKFARKGGKISLIFLFFFIAFLTLANIFELREFLSNNVNYFYSVIDRLLLDPSMVIVRDFVKQLSISTELRLRKPYLEYIGYILLFIAFVTYILLNYLPKQVLYYRTLSILENRERANYLKNADIGRKLFMVCFIISIYFIILGLEPSHLLILNLLLINITFLYPGSILLYIGLFFLILGSVFYIFFSYLPQTRYFDSEVIKIFNAVGLTPVNDYYLKYPHQLSGGERQRVAIARALILNPKLIIADEPTSMLDVSIRASILDLIADLKTRFKLSVLFITHDLATVRYFCDRVAIMYVGEIVETGLINEVYNNPRHPYTWSLIQAIPVPDPGYKREGELPSGEVPDAIKPPTGCRFHPRCPFVKEKCSQETPILEMITKNHKVACHFHEELFSEGKLKV